MQCFWSFLRSRLGWVTWKHRGWGSDLSKGQQAFAEYRINNWGRGLRMGGLGPSLIDAKECVSYCCESVWQNNQIYFSWKKCLNLRLIFKQTFEELMFGLNFLFFFPTKMVWYILAYMKAIKSKKFETLISCWTHLFLQVIFSRVDKGIFENVHFFLRSQGCYLINYFSWELRPTFIHLKRLI